MLLTGSVLSSKYSQLLMERNREQEGAECGLSRARLICRFCPSPRKSNFRVVWFQADGASNCLEYQVGRLAATSHGVPLLSIVLRIVSSFRMQTVKASFFAFPAWHKR